MEECRGQRVRSCLSSSPITGSFWAGLAIFLATCPVGDGERLRATCPAVWLKFLFIWHTVWGSGLLTPQKKKKKKKKYSFCPLVFVLFCFVFCYFVVRKSTNLNFKNSWQSFSFLLLQFLHSQNVPKYEKNGDFAACIKHFAFWLHNKLFFFFLIIWALKL